MVSMRRLLAILAFGAISITTLAVFTRTDNVALAFEALNQQGGGQGNPELDQPFGQQTRISGLAKAVFTFGIILCVIAATIYIAIGSYYYFIAVGNASTAAKGKEMIQNAIIGLLLALISWVILNTISPQFTELKDPKFNNAGGPGGQNPGGGANNPGGGVQGGNNPQPGQGGQANNPPGAQNPNPPPPGSAIGIRLLTGDERQALGGQPDQIYTMSDQPNVPLSQDQVAARITDLENRGVIQRRNVPGVNDPRAVVALEVPANVAPNQITRITDAANLSNPVYFLSDPQRAGLENLRFSLESQNFIAPIYPRSLQQ